MGSILAYDAIFVRGAGVALPLLLLALATASIGLGINPALAKPAGRRRLAVDAAAFAWLARALAAVTCYDLAARASDMRVGADGLTDSGLWTRADYCALEARGDLPGQRGLHAYWSQGLPPVPAPSLLLAVGDAPGVLLVLGGGAAAALRVAWAPARASPAWAFLAWAVVASAHNRGGRYALDGGAVTLRALWVWVALLRAEGPRPEAPTPASVGLHLQICVIYWCAWLTKVCAPGTGWQLDAKTGRADAVCIALLLEEYSRGSSASPRGSSRSLERARSSLLARRSSRCSVPWPRSSRRQQRRVASRPRPSSSSTRRSARSSNSDTFP